MKIPKKDLSKQGNDIRKIRTDVQKCLSGAWIRLQSKILKHMKESGKVSQKTLDSDDQKHKGTKKRKINKLVDVPEPVVVVPEPELVVPEPELVVVDEPEPEIPEPEQQQPVAVKVIAPSMSAITTKLVAHIEKKLEKFRTKSSGKQLTTAQPRKTMTPPQTYTFPYRHYGQSRVHWRR
jgi:hypothetical protein